VRLHRRLHRLKRCLPVAPRIRCDANIRALVLAHRRDDDDDRARLGRAGHEGALPVVVVRLQHHVVAERARDGQRSLCDTGGAGAAAAAGRQEQGQCQRQQEAVVALLLHLAV
jgi:hypothetical protein